MIPNLRPAPPKTPFTTLPLHSLEIEIRQRKGQNHTYADCTRHVTAAAKNQKTATTLPAIAASAILAQKGPNRGGGATESARCLALKLMRAASNLTIPDIDAEMTGAGDAWAKRAAPSPT